MIVDARTNMNRYLFLPGDLGTALAYLAERDLRSLPDGRSDIPGSGAFLTLQDRRTVRPSEEPFEVHRMFVDVHILLEGEEWIGYAPVTEGTPLGPYDAESDRSVFTGRGSFFRATPGLFFVFFPQDGHKTCIAMETRGMVRKIVVKVPAQ
jgi:YhcH/YjgK/YiaL family protein